MRVWLIGFIGPALVLAGAGCGSSGPRTVKINGTVTLDGKPLEGALVTFIPEAKDGHLATGRTDTGGHFQLTTFNTDDGALAGQYKVTVAKTEESKDSTTKTPDQMSDDEKMKMFMRMSPKGRNQEAKKKLASLIPAVYSDQSKTPLKETVPPPNGKVELSLSASAR
jgi:hypothetical protein